jgi:hypothetical protein
MQKLKIQSKIQKLFLGMKINKKSSSLDEKKKKNFGISFKVDNNLISKKITFDKPKLSGELILPVLDAERTKIQIILSLKLLIVY